MLRENLVHPEIIGLRTDQTGLVTQARARLAALDAAAANQGAGVTIRKLDIADDPMPWNVSADGRFLGATHYETGNAAVIDLVNGGSRNVTKYGNPHAGARKHASGGR